MTDKLIMPEEYFGGYIKKRDDTHTVPRKWTNQEVEWCKEQVLNGYTHKEIAEAIDRTEVSVSIKMKREKKKDDKYNVNYRSEKYKINKEFIEKIQPDSVLDVFSGVSDYYNYIGLSNIITNDKDKNIRSDYNLDYLKFLCLMYYKGKSFDIVDLDPFGSAYNGFDLAIKMANKGIVITFGEMGHLRFKRLDFVSRYYNIQSLEDFTVDNLIKEVQHIGLRNKKQLNVFKVMSKRNITRVWFEIEEVKITSQWE